MRHRLPKPVSAAAQLQRLGLRPRRKLSQVFLHDPGLLAAVASEAELTLDDEVLEIGPGLGALTRVLAPRCRRVVAVELDPALAQALPTLLNAENVEVIKGDALTFVPAKHFAGAYKLVANLPYHVTSPLLHHFLFEVLPPSLMVATVQREVALRIAARDGRRHYLGLAVELMAEARLVRTIRAGTFYPKPQVDSGVIKLRLRPSPAIPSEEIPAFLQFLHAGFMQPRRQLPNSLALGLGAPKEKVLDWLNRAGIQPTLRPEALALADWDRLFRAAQSRDCA